MSVGESFHFFCHRKMRAEGMRKGFKEGGQLFCTSSKKMCSRQGDDTQKSISHSSAQ